MLNGLGGENLKEYRSVTAIKYRRPVKMRTDAGSADASVLGEAGAADVPVSAHLP